MISPSKIEFVFICFLNQLLFGFFVVTLFPLLFLRWLITKLRIFIIRDVKKMLSALSCTYTIDNIEESIGNNVIFCLKLEGKLDVPKTLDRISNLVYYGKENGKFVFPEFQMYWIKWCGCPVWKLEKNFSVNKHVTHAVIPNNYQDKDEFISKFSRDMVRKPFKPKQSPWEIALVDGIDQPQCWYWLFKFHHSLADGQSVFKTLMTCSDKYVPLYQPKIPRVGLFSLTYMLVTYPFIGMYEWIKLSLESTHPNPWKLPVAQMSNSRLIVKSREILCSKINDISATKDVTFTAVLLSAVTGAIHKTIKKQGKVMPDYIVTRMPIPAPIKVRKGLTNNFSAVFMKLPTNLSDVDRDLRIVKCEEEIGVVKKSTCSLTSYLMANLLGSFPSCFQKRLFPPSFQAVQISNFPGPKEKIVIGGQPVVDMHFIVWCSKRNPMYLSVLSYNGKIRLVANVDPSVFPSEDLLQEFVGEIENQLNFV